MTDQPVHERVRQVVEPSLAAEGFELIDVERHGSVLRVTVDLLVEARDTDNVDLPAEPGELPRSIDLEGITAATRIVSDLIDANDLIGDRTTLEVSSPGIERTLRTPAHFRRFLGTEVAVKTRPGTEGERRLDGVLEAVDDDGVVVAGRALAYGDIERARTVFVWPSGAKRTQAKKIGKAS
jgi:ribosome maturation factor RimP